MLETAVVGAFRTGSPSRVRDAGVIRCHLVAIATTTLPLGDVPVLANDATALAALQSLVWSARHNTRWDGCF